MIEGGLPTEATVAQVLVSKYADHLPLYRQAQIYARQGIALDRSTLADWVGHAAFHLRPLHERLLTVLRERSKLFADEATVPVLDPGRGRTKTGQLWPGIAYVYAPDRKAERLFSHLAGFKGVMQVDVCGRPSKCKQKLTSEQACGRVLTCVRPRDATSKRRGPLWNAWIGSNSATRALWRSSTC